MLKCFCLKKKILVLSDFAPQAVGSVERTVCVVFIVAERSHMHDLRRISRSRRLYLQILELAQHFSFAAELHLGER